MEMVLFKFEIRIHHRMGYDWNGTILFLTEEDCFAEKTTDKINYGRLGVMCTGYRVINGRLCYFDQNGAYRGIRGCENGWYYAKEENDWYFMKGQRVTTGRTTVNGIEYNFCK